MRKKRAMDDRATRWAEKGGGSTARARLPASLLQTLAGQTATSTRRDPSNDLGTL
jgi:hypothetical protein